MGIYAVRARGSSLNSDDLLIVAMSAMPLLGWAKHLPLLYAMKLRWRCAMVVLVSNEISSVRLLDAVGCIVSGGYSLGWVSNALLYLVPKWQQSKPLPVGNVRRISLACGLGIDDVAYFFAQTMPATGSERLSKTEYGRRNRALVNMGFYNLQQLRLFMAGVAPPAVLNAWILLQREYPSDHTKVSKNTTSYVHYNKDVVGY